MSMVAFTRSKHSGGRWQWHIQYPQDMRYVLRWRFELKWVLEGWRGHQELPPSAHQMAHWPQSTSELPPSQPRKVPKTVTDENELPSPPQRQRRPQKSLPEVLHVEHLPASHDKDNI